MRFIGVIIALALALVAGIAVLKFTGNKEVVVSPTPQSVEVQTVNVLVARKDIPVGTEIKDSTFFDQQPWPKHLVLPQFITADQAPKIIKMVTRGPFLAREPLIMTKLANPNDPSFLAAMLPEGMRVVTVATDAVSGIAGFVFPGDRVDVIYTHEVDKAADQEADANANAKPKQATEVLVGDVKVLAVDQRSGASSGDKLSVPTTVSLEVSQEDAQKIRLAEKNGWLALALRSLKDKDNKTLTPPTEQAALSKVQAADVGRLERPIVIVRGVKVEVLRNTTTPAAEAAPAAPAAGTGSSVTAPPPALNSGMEGYR